MKKLFLLSLLTFGIVMSVYGLQHANASNNYDTKFTFIFGQSQQTEDREKLNYTSAYMKPESITGGNYFKGWVSLKDGTDVSGGYYYNLYEGQETFMVNYAGERYGIPVKIRIQGRQIHNSGTIAASGVWSPDSVR